MHNEILSLRAQVKRLEEEVNYDKRVQLYVDKLAAEFTQTEVEKLKSENDRLRASSFVTAVPVEQYDKLKAEVERLDTLCKQLMAQHSDISCENIILRKAGDAMCDLLGPSYAVREWNAAKEGKICKSADISHPQSPQG